jgi:hypothetical protein
MTRLFLLLIIFICKGHKDQRLLNKINAYFIQFLKHLHQKLKAIARFYKKNLKRIEFKSINIRDILLIQSPGVCHLKYADNRKREPYKMLYPWCNRHHVKRGCLRMPQQMSLLSLYSVECQIQSQDSLDLIKTPDIFNFTCSLRIKRPEWELMWLQPFIHTNPLLMRSLTTKVHRLRHWCCLLRLLFQHPYWKHFCFDLIIKKWCKLSIFVKGSVWRRY